MNNLYNELTRESQQKHIGDLLMQMEGKTEKEVEIINKAIVQYDWNKADYLKLTEFDIYAKSKIVRDYAREYGK